MYWLCECQRYNLQQDGEHAKVIECSLDSANKDGTLFPAGMLSSCNLYQLYLIGK